jgi:hypothetical protein
VIAGQSFGTGSVPRRAINAPLPPPNGQRAGRSPRSFDTNHVVWRRINDPAKLGGACLQCSRGIGKQTFVLINLAFQVCNGLLRLVYLL